MTKAWKYTGLILFAIWLFGYIYSFSPESSFKSGFIGWLLFVSSILLCFLAIKKFKKFKLVIIVLSVLTGIEAFLWWYPYMEFYHVAGRLIVFSVSFFVAFSVRYLSTSVRDFGKGFLIMFGLFVIALFFKRMHWPGAGPLLVISIGSIALMYLIQMMYSFSFIKKNKLLFIIGISCSFIITHFFLGWLFKLQHWPGAGFFYYNTEHYFPIAFVICSVILLAGVQITNFTNWVEEQRKFLVSNILIPWFIVFILGGWFFLFRDSFEHTIIRKSSAISQPWGMEPYETGK